MKFIRFKFADQPVETGWVLEDQVGIVEGDIFNEYRRLEAQIPITKVKLYPPVQPSKIIGIYHNFLMAGESDQKRGAFSFFYKPPSSLVGANQKILLPSRSKAVEAEAHLAVVIGKAARKIRPEQSNEHIFGFTAANNLFARDLLDEGQDDVRCRGFDGTLAIGPWLETELDPADVLIHFRVNDELIQMASTREYRITIEGLVAYLSGYMTLLPGDVILAGSPPGAGNIKSGDRLQATVEGIGELTNFVITDEQIPAVW